MAPPFGQKKNMKTAFSLGATVLLIAVGGLRGAAYDPLVVDPNFKAEVRDRKKIGA